LANRALDDCRRRTRNDALGHRGRKGNPLYGARKLLLKGTERLDAQGSERLHKALDDGDPCDEPVNSVCEDVVSLLDKKQSGIDISSEIANLAEDYDGL